MSADYRQQQEQEHEAEVYHALSRVALGLGGLPEAQILATALGPRFNDDQSRRRDAHE